MKSEILQILGQVMREQGIEDRLIERVNSALCRTAGGDRYYLPSTPTEKKTDEVGRGLARGESIKMIASRMGITERRVYQICATKWTIK